MDDPEEFRFASRRRWEAAAGGWGAAREAFQAAAEPVSRWLVDRLDPQPGQTILELAAGPGDTGLLAAERLRPGGRLISTDGAEAMVELARARAEELGLSDVVEALPMEAEWIDRHTASVDGVICRWGYMLLADPETALRETRRVLRRDGRVVLAVWDRAEANPWSMGRLLVELGFAEPSDPAAPGPFRLGDREELTGLLWSAGLQEVEVDAVDFTFTAADSDAWFDQQLDCSLSLRDLVADLSPADHYRLRDGIDEALAPHTDAEGRLAIPARTLVATATA